jgi:hypothetical protein
VLVLVTVGVGVLVVVGVEVISMNDSEPGIVVLEPNQ